MIDLGADLGDCSADAGPERPGGVFLGCGMTMGGAEAARWARLERPWSRDTDREGACWTTVVMVKCAWGGRTLITAANLSCKCRAGRIKDGTLSVDSGDAIGGSDVLIDGPTGRESALSEWRIRASERAVLYYSAGGWKRRTGGTSKQ